MQFKVHLFVKLWAIQFIAYSVEITWTEREREVKIWIYRIESREKIYLYIKILLKQSKDSTTKAVQESIMKWANTFINGMYMNQACVNCGSLPLAGSTLNLYASHTHFRSTSHWYAPNTHWSTSYKYAPHTH